MISHLPGNLRIYAASAIYAYRALYAWQSFGPYISGKVVFPIAQMLFFLFMGILAGVPDPLYIVIGHILLLPATNGVLGVSMTIAGERDFRTLPYLIACPAPRAPLILGRSLVHMLDGLLSSIVALILGVLLFHIDLSQADLPLLAICIGLISVTSCGIGLVFGSWSLRSREAQTISGMVAIILYMLSGVNFPVEVLPRALQALSYALPMTRGIQAARLAMQGLSGPEVQFLIAGEMLVGLAYIVAGYFLFIWFEKLSLVDGQIEAM